VIIPPLFTTAPANTSVVEGESATMECRATGKPNPLYKWVDRNSQDLNNRERFSVDAETGQLTISQVMRTDAGEISCLVENRAGKISQVAMLNVILKPTVVDYANVTVVNGQVATLMCKATGDPLPSVSFLKEGSLTPFAAIHDDRISVESVTMGDSTVATLSIRDVVRSDDGLYGCIAENVGGNATKAGHITVQFPPSFAETPMNEAWTWDGHLVNLTCRPQAIPNATVTWYMNDRNLEYDPNIKINAFNGESTITVTPADLSYYAKYKCEAVNIYGKDQHFIQLREARIPGDLLQVKFVTTTATTITFDFVGPADDGGLPIDAFVVQYKNNSQDTWEQSGKERVWVVGGHKSVAMHEPLIKPADNPYILEDLEPLMTYTFRFAVKNQVGYSQWSAPQEYRMPKIAAPEEPVFIGRMINKVVSSSYHDSYELLWKIPNDNGAHIQRFQIIFFSVRNDSKSGVIEDGQVKKTINIDDPTTVKYNLNGLKASTLYRVELRAYNEIGYSAPAEILVRTAKNPSGSKAEGSSHWSGTSGSATTPNHPLVPFFTLLLLSFAL